MNRVQIIFKVFVFSLLLLLSSSFAKVGAAANGGKCSKVGQIQITKGMRYVCTKTGKKFVWQVKRAPVNGNTHDLAIATTTAPLGKDAQLTSAQDLLSDPDCRLSDVTSGNSAGVSSGFPRPSWVRSNIGQIRILVIPISFSNLPFKESDQIVIEETYTRINQFFVAMSNGRASVKMAVAPKGNWAYIAKSIEESGFANQQWGVDRSSFFRDVLDRYIQKNPLLGYDIVQVSSALSQDFYLGQSLSPGPGDFQTGKDFTGMLIVGKVINNWGYVAHELGHSWLAFEDLYTNEGEPYGGWDLMSRPSAELSGWSRYLAGWLDQKDVRCANHQTSSRHFLSPVNASKPDANPRLLVVPLSASSGIVVELRVPNEWSVDLSKPTVVVYRIDTSFEHGNGPIKLLGTIDLKGGIITTNGVKFSVEGINSSGVTISLIAN